MNVPNQENLIQRARSGDALAFETLVKAFYPLILNFSYRLLGSRADAEDATQDVFVKAAKKLSSLRKPSVFSAWLYSIASSTCTDLIRKRSRQRVNEKHYSEACASEFDLPKNGSVWELVGRLPQALKDAVVLVYWEGVNHAHAATILNCAESTVSWRVHEAKKQLRGMLEECI